MSFLTDIEDYYKDLLILQYNNKPNAQATIKLLTDCGSGDGIFDAIQNGFDFDTAVGTQLDILGNIIGAPRSGLSDSDYRILLKFKIVWNNMDGKMKTMDDIVYSFFGNSISIVNNMDMTITYIIQQQYSVVLDVITELGFLVAPNGVGATYIALKPLPTQIFGFNTQLDSVSAIGFSTAEQNRQGVFLTNDNLV